MKALALALSFSILLGLPRNAAAKEYRVGPGEKNTLLSHVADALAPGDTVLITGDIRDSVKLTRDGWHGEPITIRGLTRIENGRIVRPKMTRSQSSYIMSCAADWIVVEGIEFDGEPGGKNPTSTGVSVGGSNVVLRNCLFVGFRRRALACSPPAGNITVEFCEFDASASVDIRSSTPGAVATVQFCWFHDLRREGMLRMYGPRNIVRYNWFENPASAAIKIVDRRVYSRRGQDARPSGLYPMHTDIVGNVFFTGWSPGSQYAVLSLGGAAEDEAGTEGDFHIAHNLFVMTRVADGDPGVHMLVHGNVDHVRAYNNVFVELGGPGCRIYERGNVWEVPTTDAFRKKRGNGEPIVEGSNNWISEKSIGIPEGFMDTLRGINPKFVDLVNFDFHPGKDSPLVGAGMWPLPMGRVAELVPEYEPQRGIPLDLKPKARKAVPPSIGPFEAAE